MSRQNKVNPGTYTQRGRLAQDDAARELRNQSAIGSPHTWSPANTKTRLTPAGDAPRDRQGSADNDAMVVETANKAASSTAKAKAAKAKTARTRESKRTTGNSKTEKAVTTATKRTTTKATRKSRTSPQR